MGLAVGPSSRLLKLKLPLPLQPQIRDHLSYPWASVLHLCGSQQFYEVGRKQWKGEWCTRKFDVCKILTALRTAKACDEGTSGLLGVAGGSGKAQTARQAPCLPPIVASEILYTAWACLTGEAKTNPPRLFSKPTRKVSGGKEREVLERNCKSLQDPPPESRWMHEPTSCQDRLCYLPQVQQKSYHKPGGYTARDGEKAEWPGAQLS